MTDLNMMMREQARNGLQAQLDAAVTNGDTVAATKIADDIAKLAVSTAPKTPPYVDADIRAELDKQPWFGVDPKKSAKAAEFGRNMDPKKYPTAVAFAEAIVKAVDAEFKPPAAAGADDEDAGDDDGDEDGDENGKEKPAPKPRRTDGPNDGDANQRSSARGSSKGPWAKLSDAPSDVQKEINRQADKFVSSNATKEQRATFVAKSLESHYAQAQRNKGKK